MKTEVFECDRCHKKAITDAERKLLGLGKISIAFRAEFHGFEYYPNGEWNKDICRTCRAELGVLERKNDESNQPVSNTAVSFEDMIREIVRQELP